MSITKQIIYFLLSKDSLKQMLIKFTLTLEKGKRKKKILIDDHKLENWKHFCHSILRHSSKGYIFNETFRSITQYWRKLFIIVAIENTWLNWILFLGMILLAQKNKSENLSLLIGLLHKSVTSFIYHFVNESSLTGTCQKISSIINLQRMNERLKPC